MSECDNYSEFGKGLTYCLGLFLCHSEREIYRDKPLRDPGMWFYGAADHLFDLQIPESLPVELRTRLELFQNKCLHWRLPMGDCPDPTEEDKTWAINEAKELLRLCDQNFGVETMEASWK